MKTTKNNSEQENVRNVIFIAAMITNIKLFRGYLAGPNIYRGYKKIRSL